MIAGLRGLRTFLLERGGLVALAAGVLYVWLAPSHITGGDNAEFATLGTVGGVAHPSGYPLYLLWLRGLSWLPADSPAHATAIATSLLGVAQLLVLHAACRAWGARWPTATLAIAVFAASPLVLQFYTEAEVFALNGLIAALVLWFAADSGPLTGAGRVAALCFVAGLGLSNHSTCVLLAPIGILGVVRGLRETHASRVGVGAFGVAALAAGLLPYLYLFVTPQTQLSWTRIDSLGGLVHHFLRGDYGSSKLTSRGEDVQYGAQLLALVQSLGVAWLWLILMAALGGLAWFSVKPRRAASRASMLALAASFVLAGPVLVTRFNLEPVGTGLFICRRFHLLPTLLLVIPAALALDEIVTRIPKLPTPKPVLISILAVAGFAALASRSLPHHMRAQSPAIENAVRGMLASVPRNAVLILAPESLYFGAGYVQDVLGERTDVVVISWPMMKSAEYRGRIERRMKLTLDGSDNQLLSLDVAQKALASGRAVFIDAFGGNIARSYPTYPYGILYRVLPRGASPPPLTEQLAENDALFAKLDFAYPLPDEDDEPAATIHVLYGRAWWMLARGLTAAGHRAEAERATQMAERMAP